MQLIKLVCPNCGANLEVGANRELFFCSYCGTKLTFPKKAIRYEYVSRDETEIEKAKYKAITQINETKYKSRQARYGVLKGIGLLIGGLLLTIVILAVIVLLLFS